MTLDELIEELKKWQEKYGQHKVFRHDSEWGLDEVERVVEDHDYSSLADILVIE